MTTRNLDRLFDPRSVAVIGASQDLTSISGQPLAHLRSHGYRGNIYPVNPKYTAIDGVKTYSAIGELPETPDLALILVNAARVPGVLRECGEKGISFAIIFSAGFSEIGAEGAILQQRVAETAKKYNVGVVGPNCQGMMNIPENVYAGFGSPFKMQPFRAGPVSMVSQSGGFGYSMASLAEEAGLGFRKIMSIGNEAGLTSMDFMEHFVDDEGTKIVVGYIEGLQDAYRLLEVGAAALARKKPILVWKMGRTEIGQKAAASHTGNLGGQSALYDALFKQKCIIQVEDVQDLIDYSNAFLYGKLPHGSRVAVVTASGGAGVALADQCAQSGLQFPSLAAQTIKKLRALLPAFSSLINPIDATPSLFNRPTGSAGLREVFQHILDDPNIDSLIVANSSVHGALATGIAQVIMELDRATTKPIFVCWSARDALAGDAFRILKDAKIPCYKTPTRCGKALGAVTRFALACRGQQAQQSEEIACIERPAVRAALRSRQGMISEYEAKAYLREYGICTTGDAVASSIEEARQIAGQMGYPVVIKIHSADISHKTEAGGVRLGISSDAELSAAYSGILESARRHSPQARIDGVLVQEMVRGGAEVILGILNSRQFGPAIMFGLGGIFTEVLNDVSFRFAPVTDAMARDMIAETKAAAILKGARGAPGVDVGGIASTIVKLSAMAIDLKEEIAELDINPLFVLRESGEAKAGDALISLADHQAARA